MRRGGVRCELVEYYQNIISAATRAEYSPGGKLITVQTNEDNQLAVKANSSICREEKGGGGMGRVKVLLFG